MPRAKVHPDARRRVVQACRQCKSSKRKCNASLPCSNCLKRGVADECDYSDGGTVSNPSSASKSKSQRRQSNSATSDDPSTDGTGANLLTPIRSNTEVPPAFDQPATTYDTRHGSVHESSPDTTRARMLSNNHGQHVFVGRSASLSFLQLVRETVIRCIGQCDFSEHASRSQMLEVDLDSDTDAQQELLLSASQKKHCIDHYFLATAGLIDVLTPEEATQLIEDESNVNVYLSAVRLLVIAIGMQSGPSTSVTPSDIEKRAFVKARTLVFTSMLENPSLDMIRAFLLLSLYLLGACRRNAAFLYLGIAARAAYTLGLHTAESYTVLHESLRHTQLKCWKSLVSLDIMVSSVLGRTTAILAQRSNPDTVVRITDNISNHPSMELESVYRLALMIDLISSQFNGHDPITAEMARGHLQSLSNWSSILPAKLRPSTIPEDHSSQTRQSLLGCMHISCFYYFAVMLVTRPFLIVHVTKRLFQRKAHIYQASVTDQNDVEELASACLNAAIYMAQTCSDLLDLQLLAENMCLLKAWIFAAGLVLGFELFTGSNIVKGVDVAFRSCCRVLQKFAAKSPQAQQYHEILVLLSSAVEKHRQVRQVKKQQKGGFLVARIMDLHSLDATRPPQATDSLETGMTQDLSMNTMQLPLFDGNMDNMAALFPDGSADFATSVENFSIPTPDSFMYDLSSFGTMPWGFS